MSKQYYVRLFSLQRFVAEIEKNRGKFKKFPIGPLGAHIQLQPHINDAQARLIEHEIKGLFSAFLIDNFDDKRVLDQIAGWL